MKKVISKQKFLDASIKYLKRKADDVVLMQSKPLNRKSEHLHKKYLTFNELKGNFTLNDRMYVQ